MFFNPAGSETHRFCRYSCGYTTLGPLTFQVRVASNGFVGMARAITAMPPATAQLHEAHDSWFKRQPGSDPHDPRWQSQSSMHLQAAGLKHLTLFTLLGLSIALCCRYAWVRSESSLTSSACALTLFFGMATHAHVKPPALA